MSQEGKSFGQVLRERRIAKGYSLRKFAEMVGVSPTYLSQVEQGKVDKPPTAERVRRMAELLGENVDELSALAGRMPADIQGIINQQPTQMPELLREASGLTPEQLKQFIAKMRRAKEKDQ